MTDPEMREAPQAQPIADDQPDLALPHAVALSWGVAERPQRGPKRELSIERIVDAAIEIADAEGLGALSMARVASALGFTTMSLYRYVTSKDDLLLLMQDAVAGEIEMPEPDDDGWRSGMRAWTLANLGALRRHPWYSQIPVQGPPTTPNVLRLIDEALRMLDPTPLQPQEKMACVLLLSSYTRAVGGIQSEIDAAAPAPGSAEAQVGRALAALVTPERFPYLAPVIAAGLYADGDDFDDFGFGLERVLDGLQRFIDESAASAVDASEAESTTGVVEAEEARLYGSDKRLKEAAKSRREAEKALREARKRERDALRNAREAARNAAERQRAKA